MPRRFLFLLGLALLIGVGTRAFARSFPDTVGTVYSDAFTYLSSQGVVEGYPDGSGRPNGFLNRAEAVKVLLGLRKSERVQWYKDNLPPLPLFDDIDQSAWYAPYVEAAFEARMITGYPDLTFRPGNYLSVEEAVTLAMRTYGIQGTTGAANLSQHIQNRDGEWFTPFINEAIRRNLIMKQGRLELGHAITRGQFFDILYRLDSIQKAGRLTFEGGGPSLAPTQSTATVINFPQGGASINAPQPATLQVDHPYASEKHFAISMPDLGISDLAITHPLDPFTHDGILGPLEYGVGHLFSYPGAGGKIMIYGHSSGYPWDVSEYTRIFRQVNKLSVGDQIYVTYEGKVHTYSVSRKQTIDAEDTTPFNDDGTGEELILYTCWPPDSIAQRYLVHAVPVAS